MSVKGRHPHRPHVSRDYDAVMPCLASHCPANNKLRHTCMMPSAVKIGADLKCKTGENLVATMPQGTRRPVDGD